MLDWVLAVVLTVGGLMDAASVLGRGLDAAAVVSCVAVTASVAWRRANPVLATAVATSAYPALVLVSGYSSAGTFQWVAIALNFYTLGHRERGSVVVAAALFAYWLVGSVVVWYFPSGGSVGQALATWGVGVAPFAFGRILAAR